MLGSGTLTELLDGRNWLELSYDSFQLILREEKRREVPRIVSFLHEDNPIIDSPIVVDFPYHGRVPHVLRQGDSSRENPVGLENILREIGISYYVIVVTSEQVANLTDLYEQNIDSWIHSLTQNVNRCLLVIDQSNYEKLHVLLLGMKKENELYFNLGDEIVVQTGTRPLQRRNDVENGFINPPRDPEIEQAETKPNKRPKLPGKEGEKSR